MISSIRGRRLAWGLVASIVFGGFGAGDASAQQSKRFRLGQNQAKAQEQAEPHAEEQTQDGDSDSPAQLTVRAVPVNPTDAIALVNGQPITRQQLADECVSRHGIDVLETLIARSLVEQAMKKKGLQVTASEIDAQIDADAATYGVSREGFLRILDKERKISPSQYARDIAYPSIALRKLAEPRVQVTPEEVDEAFDARFGEKLQCRAILVESLQKAKDVWAQVKANPGGFARIAKEASIDPSSAAVGGLLSTPITRHAFPRNVSDAAFRQLVDGDPDDKPINEEEAERVRPKDGSFTGPIQVDSSTWVILMREQLESGEEVDRSDPALVEEMKALIHKAKLDAEMQTVIEELMFESSIDNKLTGQVKLSKQEEQAVQVDEGELQERRLAPPSDGPSSDDAVQKAGSTGALELPQPVGAPEAPDRIGITEEPMPE